VNWKTLIYPLAVASCLFFVRVTAQGRLPCPTPQDRTPVLVSVLTRSQPGFTEGLLWHDGNLVESTGAYHGTSMINQINPGTGAVSPLLTTPNDSFGEGLTFIENHFVQLTWKDGVAFDYTKALQLQRSLPFPHEGWGLTNDGTNLVFSNGTSQITFADPINLQTRRTITVQDREGNLYSHLNALSFADSALYANVFQTDQLIKTDPLSGCVLARYNLNSLRASLDSKDLEGISKDPQNDVFNGIAYDPGDKSFYLTGKNWLKIFKVRLPS
jgi:glutamine cyclotransferase